MTTTHSILAWGSASQVRAKGLAEHLEEDFAPRTLAAVAAVPGQLSVAFEPEGDTSGGWHYFWAVYEEDAAEPQDHVVHAVRSDSEPGTFTIHDTTEQRGVGLGSKAFGYGDDVLWHLVRDSTLYRTYFTQQADGQMVVARILPVIAGGLVPKAGHLPSVWPSEDDADVAIWPAIYVTDVESADGDVFAESGIRRVELDFDSPEAFRSSQLGDCTYIAGGHLHCYDGARIVEAGFHYGIDDVPTPTQSAPSGAGVAVGSYNYVFVPENILATGEVERGPASARIPVAVAGSAQRVTFQIPTVRLTAKPNARIGVYRSADGDDSFYYRVSSLDPSATGPNGFVANDKTVDRVEFSDEMSDADLILQEPLYTVGGITPNNPIGGARLVAGGKNRLFVVDKADGLAVYPSQELSEGYAPEFGPRGRVRLDPYGGDITGIVVMDDSIVAFKETAIFVVGGEGPAASPSLGGGWVAPQLVTSDVGCISADSIGYTPLGVLFQSHKGIYLLGRDHQVAYIGAPVEAYNDQRIVATTLIEDRTEIRFLTDSGATLLYDYERGQWSTFTNHEGQDAIVVGGLYHYLRNNGAIWRETPGQYRDVNSHIKRAEETAWLKLAGHAQGWQRLWWMQVLGEWKSAHKLRVYIGYDYEEGWSGPPIVIDPSEDRVTAPFGDGAFGAGPFGGSPDTRYQYEIHVGQECQAVRFRFEDVEDADDAGASYELSELLLVGGIERGRFQIEEGRRY